MFLFIIYIFIILQPERKTKWKIAGYPAEDDLNAYSPFFYNKGRSIDKEEIK